MANMLLTPKMITKEALRILENNLVFAKGVNRQYDDKFAVKGAKIGNNIDVRKPPRYIGTETVALTTEDTVDTVLPVTLNKRFQVAVTFTSQELTLDINDFSDKILKSAVATIANKIDRDGLTYAYQRTYNAVGTPGTTPSALRTYLLAGAKLDENGCPRDGKRSVVINPDAQVEIVDALKGLFQSSTQVKNQYERGVMGTASGFDWAMDQNIVTHTVGPLGGTPLVNGAQAGLTTGWAATGSLITDGWTAAAASRLKKGDVFTIAGVYMVNPQSRQSTGKLQQFTVTADVSSDGSGNLTLTMAPQIISAGQFQNVTNAAADNAAITVLGAASTLSPQNLAYHENAFTVATADLELPSGVDFAARAADKAAGFSVRMVRAYDINTDAFPCRLDVLYGWAELYPEWACRVVG